MARRRQTHPSQRVLQVRRRARHTLTTDRYNFTSSTILKALTQHVALAWFLLHDELASMKRVEETIGSMFAKLNRLTFSQARMGRQDPARTGRLSSGRHRHDQRARKLIASFSNPRLTHHKARLSTNAVTVQNFTLPLQISEFVKDLFASFSIVGPSACPVRD